MPPPPETAAVYALTGTDTNPKRMYPDQTERPAAINNPLRPGLKQFRPWKPILGIGPDARPSAIHHTMRLHHPKRCLIALPQGPRITIGTKGARPFGFFRIRELFGTSNLMDIADPWILTPGMGVISRKRLREFWQEPGRHDSEGPLRAWFHEAIHADWSTPAELKASFKSAR